MTDSQATILGKRAVALLELEVYDGMISTMWGKKTYKGLGFAIENLVKKVESGKPVEL